MLIRITTAPMMACPKTGISLDAQELQRLAPQIEAIIADLASGRGDNRDGTVSMLGWQDEPQRAQEYLPALRSRADALAGQCDLVFIIGIGGSYLGPRAMYNLFGSAKGRPELAFLGYATDPRAVERTLSAARGRRVGCVVISKSGSTIEPGLAFRLVRKLIVEQHAEDAASRIAVITGPGEKNLLNRMAAKQGWTTLLIPPEVGGRFSVLSPVGLFPAALMGLDVGGMLNGARQAKLCCDRPEFSLNPAAQYAAVKFLACDKGARVEYQVTNIEDFEAMLGWTTQLEAESEGHCGHGVHIVPALFPRDLHSIGQLIQQGPRNCYEVATTILDDRAEVAIPADPENSDGLSSQLASFGSLSRLNRLVLRGALAAHREGGVPHLTIELAERSSECLGAYFYCMMKATAIQGYLLRHNPFVQPGVRLWKESLQKLADVTAAATTDAPGGLEI